MVVVVILSGLAGVFVARPAPSPPSFPGPDCEAANPSSLFSGSLRRSVSSSSAAVSFDGTMDVDPSGGAKATSTVLPSRSEILALKTFKSVVHVFGASMEVPPDRKAAA